MTRWRPGTPPASLTITSLAIGPGAHVRQASAQSNVGAIILRKGFSCCDGYRPDGTPDAGLLFTAFQADPANGFTRIQQRLALADDLSRFVRQRRRPRTPLGWSRAAPARGQTLVRRPSPVAFSPVQRSLVPGSDDLQSAQGPRGQILGTRSVEVCRSSAHGVQAHSCLNLQVNDAILFSSGTGRARSRGARPIPAAVGLPRRPGRR
jgi:hypothetical protein